MHRDTIFIVTETHQACNTR